MSERMVLRPLVAKDVPVVQRLARSRKVAYMTHWLFLPHSEQKALRWIDFTAKNFAQRSSVEFAIQLKCGGRMVGLIGLDHINAQDSVAEVWYMLVPTCWPGRPTEHRALTPADYRNRLGGATLGRF